jgi:hypothetical protein
MAAVVGHAADLGLAVEAPVGQPRPPQAPPAGQVPPGQPPPGQPRPVAAINADMTGYELSYDIYFNQLKPSLISNYSEPREQPVRGRRAEQEAEPASVPGGDPVKAELVRIKAYLNDATHPGRRPPDFNKDKVNNLVNRARDSDQLTALEKAEPFDVAAYRVAVLSYLNANAPTGFNFAGVGP